MSSKRTPPPPRLLVVDNDARYGEWLRHHLGVLCPDAAVSVLDRGEFERWSDMLSGRDCDVLLLAAPFGSSPEDPQATGLELLRRLRGKPVFPAIIAIAEEGNELTAVRAMQLGAVDYLPKRLLTPDRLRTAVRLALHRLERHVARRLANLAHVSEASAETFKATETGVLDFAFTGSTATQPPMRPPMTELSPEAAHAASGVIASAAAATPAAAAPGAPSAAPQPTASARSPESQTPAPATPPATDDEGDSAVLAAMVEETAERPRLELASSPAVRAAAARGAVAPITAGNDFIPGYIIRMKIGESEKSIVYLAFSAALDHDVALKVSKTLRDDSAGRQFLEREYTAIIAIRDPSVVKIFDYGVHAGFEYLAMEYFPRGDLKARMHIGVTEQESLSYVEKIAAALRVVHRAGIIHRDLKPPNVMLREDDNVALIDFGLARTLDGSSSSTRTGVLRGSPYYMSPEQALGEQLDTRSDFYSLGILFYEMLTGRKPFTGATAMEVLQQHVNSPVPRLPAFLMHCEPLLTRLMAKTRQERFSKAEEIIEAISMARADTLARESRSTAA